MHETPQNNVAGILAISNLHTILGNFPKITGLVLLIPFLLAGQLAQAQVDPDSTAGDTARILPFVTDMDSLMGDSTALGDSAVALSPQAQYQQRVKDSLRGTSDLTGTVSYQAEDSIVYDVKTGKLYLYNTSVVNYEDFGLKSERISVNINDQQVDAEGVENSEGELAGTPEFTQGGETYKARTMSYNFSSEKARIKGGRLVQGEAFILADVAKLQPDKSIHTINGRFTTCNHDHPHFYIQSRKLKVLDDKQVITGPMNLVIADFPVPIYLPFGFVPNLDQGKKSGFILPQYGEAQDKGFFLRGLGWYFRLNDYMDLTLKADVYTSASWRLQASSRYKVRYKFNGGFNLAYGVERFNEPEDPDFLKRSAWSLTWNHTQPIDPTASFNASVNISSSSTYQREISPNQNDFFQNNLRSSIAFSKNFNNLPFNFSVSASHSQDLNKGTMSLQLPTFTLGMQRQNPFRRISGKNLDFLKQFGINYRLEGQNSLPTIADTLFPGVLFNPSDTVFVREVVNGDTVINAVTGSSLYRNGLRHTASAATSFKVLNFINVSPSFNWTERWYTQTVSKSYNDETQRIEDTPVEGFFRAYDYSASVSASSNFFGIYKLTKSKREVAFRQRFTPSVGYSIRPDFSQPSYGFYDKVQSNSDGDSIQYSIFEGSIYGSPPQGESQAISFSLASVLEMKYRKKESFDPDFDEKEDKYERRNLLDNLSVSTSYNFAADSFQLAPIALRARTSLLNRKLNLNASATLDPYVFGYDDVSFPERLPNPRRQNRFTINEDGTLGRLTRAQVTLAWSYDSNSKKRGKSSDDARRELGNEFDEDEYLQSQVASYEYVDFNIPWRVNLNYSFNYSKPSLDAARIVQTVNATGDFNFTEKWKVGFRTGFDIQNLELTSTQVTVFRDLHCWQMSFQWTPFGTLRSYSVSISARSSTLSALRLSKNDYWNDRFQPL
ncbi:putative LPS assembly protein LptD [Pontibacter sp. G13]|uniref:putative LPS assembly protein LptD n=1 Tax=Pontibacter sp. G13 TaxID=3074898 RepID=UPI002889BF84|nr:putative LPS assembly protein LptD [Pontibacter sp. G13]WNJ19347.1 putative LPS assembly protein LptD [Pontibacter sp. G13]